VAQGGRTTQALFNAQQNELDSLAILTAQRPTLQRLVAEDDLATLPAYLATLREGAGLDLLGVCNPDGQPIAQSGDLPAAPDFCALEGPAGYGVVAGEPAAVWLLAAQALESPDAGSGRIVAGLALDDRFAVLLRDQTGLEITFLVNGQRAGTTFAAGPPTEITPAAEADQVTFEADGRRYNALRLPLAGPGGPDLVAEVALSVADVAAAQQRLTRTLLGSILAVAAVGTLFGAFLAQRIGRPLADLSVAAATLSKGDLDTPVAVETSVREVALVGYALEDARSALQHTLAELRQEKAWTDHLLEAVVEGIVALDQAGRITFFSHGAERITGWQQAQVLGRAVDEVFQPAEAAARFSQLIPAAGQTQKVVVALRDGRQATLSISGARLAPPVAGRARVALVLRDVSDEEAIRRLLGDFLANIAHEFRTPLSALTASIELLLDQLPDLSPAELLELLNSLHLGTLGLQTLVDNLLEGASIETGRFRVFPQPADLAEIVNQAVQVIQPLLAKYGQHLELQLPAGLPPVQADRRRIEQVLVNLLSNASKYGPADAEITLAVTLSDGQVRVATADRGPGIPVAHQPEIFRRFVHLGPGDDKARYGIGLGLSVVKAIVEAHRGQVGVADRPGGGAVFWFTLPVVEAA
jgi:PAS domain S-box-containing protein